MFDAKQVGTTPYYDAVSLIPALNLPIAFFATGSSGLHRQENIHGS